MRLVRHSAWVLATSLLLSKMALTGACAELERLDKATRSAVAAAAGKLFPESGGATPTVTSVKYVERFVDGFEYEVFEVVGAAGARLGRLTRVQVHPDARSTIDFAVRLEKDRIVGFQPVRPIRLGGKPFDELGFYFENLAPLGVGAYAHPLEKLFGSLRLLSTADVEPGPYRPQPGAPPVLTMESRKLALGDPMPEFQVQGLEGQTLSRAAFAGKPAIIAFGSIREEASRVMLKRVERFAGTVAEAGVLKVLVDTAEEKDLFLGLENDPESLLAHGTIDPEKALRDLFRVPLTPYVYVFDRESKVVFAGSWRGADALSSDLADVFAKFRKPATPPSGAEPAQGEAR
ncbi:MAG: redoxin domain-containing protein [Candidatus Wallbacteria bacterium]|nr:redoxin domain-containing protein [Candidatus Wallbacteria bacterium]